MHSSASVSKYKANMFQAEILSCRFDPTGQNIAACSADRSICAFCFALHFYSNKLTSIFLCFLMCSLLADVSSQLQLRPPPKPRQSADPRPAMVALLPAPLLCRCRPHSIFHRCHHGRARPSHPRPPRDYQRGGQEPRSGRGDGDRVGRYSIG